MKTEHQIPIQIDHRPFKALSSSMTGAQIKGLIAPPLQGGYDLFQVVPGPADDLKIGDDQEVALKEGMHFFTAPSTINPGASHAVA